MNKKFVVLKLSGFVLETQVQIQLIPELVAQLHEHGFKIIIVHGAGKQVDRVCEQKGIPIQKINGRRVTSPEIMELMLELVHGQLNRQIVGVLLEKGISAIGLTTADAHLLQFKKRPPKLIESNWVDFGQVGDFVSIDSKKISILSELGTPVISCIGFDSEFGWLNINADTITKEIAIGLHAEKVLMASETAGVKNEHHEWMKVISTHQITDGIQQGWIKDGMIVKLEQAIELANKGIEISIGTISGLLNGEGTLVKK